jgi:hypothetical protein
MAISVGARDFARYRVHAMDRPEGRASYRFESSRRLDGPVKTDGTFGVTRSRPHCPTGLLNLAVGLFPRAAAICRSPETARAPHLSSDVVDRPRIELGGH